MDAILTGPLGPTQLGPGVTVLGRTQDNQIVVNDVKASSHHAELRSTGQDYIITDLGSTNGTFVNGQPLDRAMPRILHTGDTIRIGDTTYTFEVRNSQQPAVGMYGGQGTNPGFAPTQMAQPQYPGTAYGGSPGGQNFPPTQPAADFQQAGFQPYPAQQNNFTPPPPGGSSFNQYNQPTQAASYVPPPPQYNPGAPYGPPPVPGTYAPQGASMPPYVQPPTPPRKGGGLRTIILASLALLVILGAAATFFIVRTNQIANANATATATALTARTATARTTATAGAVAAQATGTALVNATATAGAGTIQDGAYATGTVALTDPLKDNKNGNQWQEDTNCSFNQDVYEVKESHQNTFVTCFAQGTNFSNFSYRALMTVVSGDCSGIAFRGNANSNKQYYFEVCQSGTYDLLLFDGSTDKYLIRPTSSSSIKSGVGKINIVAVTANNDTIQLYANGVLLNTAQDATLTSGSIGVVAINRTSASTDAIFAGAKVWTM